MSKAPLRQPGQEDLAAGQHLAAGDGQRAGAAERAEIVERVGHQRLLEPADIVGGQHLSRAQRPFQPVGPMRVAGPGIDEELRVVAGGGAGSRDDRLVGPGTAGAPERPPADLEGAKAQLAIGADNVGHALRHLHQQRAIGAHALAVAAAEQPAHGHGQRLAEDVPKRHVDAADRMGERAAAAHPEGVLVQLLGDPLGLQRVLAPIERLQHLQPGLDQPAIGEDAAIAGDAGVGVHGDQRVDGIFGLYLDRPTAFRALTDQWQRADGGDRDLRQDAALEIGGGRLGCGHLGFPTGLLVGSCWRVSPAQAASGVR